MRALVTPVILLAVTVLLLVYGARTAISGRPRSSVPARMQPPKWLAVIVYTGLFVWLAHFLYHVIYLDLIVPRQMHAYLREHRCFVSGRDAASGISYKCQDGTTVWHKW